MSPAAALLRSLDELRGRLAPLPFAPPVAHVYNPLAYAWPVVQQYITRYAHAKPKAILLGMNPGPFGMVQTGIPFGEIRAVRDWMGLDAPITAPTLQHPKRPITGWATTRSEVSGARLWGWAAARYGSAEAFFHDFFVLNYCPLAFLGPTGANLTPDKLPKSETAPLFAACDTALAQCVGVLQPQWVIGVGGFAKTCAQRVVATLPATGRPQIGQILHPSPASPAANRGWAQQVDAELVKLGILS